MGETFPNGDSKKPDHRERIIALTTEFTQMRSIAERASDALKEYLEADQKIAGLLDDLAAMDTECQQTLDHYQAMGEPIPNEFRERHMSLILGKFRALNRLTEIRKKILDKIDVEKALADRKEAVEELKRLKVLLVGLGVPESEINDDGFPEIPTE